MTPEQWKTVEQELSRAYGSVEMIIDGYAVTLVVDLYKELRYAIFVYVNGKIKFTWWLSDQPDAEAEEIRNRFYQKHENTMYSMMSQSKKNRLKKEPKETREAIKKMHQEKKCVSYTPYWVSFRSLKSHLIRNNSSIELKSGGEI